VGRPKRETEELTYPLRTAARLTGLSPELLRAWERRHGVVEPLRTPGGTRRYSAADLERLLLIREIGERWANRQIGIASEHLATGVLRSLLGSALVPTATALLGPRVVLATPTGERHELGLLMAPATSNFRTQWSMLNPWKISSDGLHCSVSRARAHGEDRIRRKGPWSTEQIGCFLEALRILIDRCLEDSNSRLAGFPLARVGHETAIAIEPQTLASWDYRERMGDAA
jgi:hypothetical protein